MSGGPLARFLQNSRLLQIQLDGARGSRILRSVPCPFGDATAPCVESFDPETDKWRFVKHIRKAHADALLSILKERGSLHRAGETDIPPGALLSPKVGPSAGEAAGAADLDA